ncbi:MAG: carbohydrate ABC transporter permease, partial [Clostridia bacterium]|nr:carbohydrate ABC transporter permease [Clostridia bacterium]
MANSRHSRMTRGERIFASVNAVLLIVISLMMVYPFLYVIYASLSDPVQFARFSGALLRPLGWDTGAYSYVLKNPNILMGYENTVFYVLVGTAMQMAVTILSAYVLSRKRYLWKKALSMFVMFTMFFNGGLIPTYLQVNALGIANTRWAMILPKLIITFNLIILRTGFEAVPLSLEESAKLDGA